MGILEEPERLSSNEELSFRKGNRAEKLQEEVSFNNSNCTKEIEEEEKQDTKEPEESEEAEESKEAQEIDDLNPALLEIINPVISECTVGTGKEFDSPLFMLAHKVRGLEETLKRRFSVDATSAIIQRWQSVNQSRLDHSHDYLAEFFDKLSLVRFPPGRALFNAYEAAKKQSAPKQTMRLSRDVQLLACLCRELQREAETKPFFLAGRSAAKVLGKPHETVASWLRTLQYLGVISLVSKGQRGFASRYRYIARD
jgi:hypothetical protein